MKSKIVLALVLISVFLLHMLNAKAQNIGVGTSTPQKKLTVNGSIMLDQSNQNNGTLDTAALLFGNNGQVGIVGSKTAGFVNGLSFWTGGAANFNISSNGSVGIGGPISGAHKFRVYNGSSAFDGSVNVQSNLTVESIAAIGGTPDPIYRLRVYDGNVRFGGDMHATGNVAFGGDVDNNYRLRVWGGNTRFGGDMHATGNVAIGGDVDNNFRLRVIGGNSRFGGNAEVTGALTANSVSVDNGISAASLSVDALTIGGKGSVRSNGNSPLRIGFDQKSVDVFIANNSAVWVEANITDFSGDNDDVRTFVSQIAGDVGASVSWANVTITVMGVNATNNTCLLWLRNNGGGSGIVKGTIYLTTIAKN